MVTSHIFKMRTLRKIFFWNLRELLPLSADSGEPSGPIVWYGRLWMTLSQRAELRSSTEQEASKGRDKKGRICIRELLQIAISCSFFPAVSSLGTSDQTPNHAIALLGSCSFPVTLDSVNLKAASAKPLRTAKSTFAFAFHVHRVPCWPGRSCSAFIQRHLVEFN